MAIIYSYPSAIPTLTDLVLGTDVDKNGNPTKNFTIGSILDLITAGAAGLGATIKLTTPLGDARDPVSLANQPIVNLSNITGTGNVTGFASFSTLAGASINGTVGSGFTAFTSTVITGTLQTAAQPNITSLGTLTGLKIGVNTPVISAITSSIVGGIAAPGVDTAFATTKAIVDYVLTNPGGAESLSATLLVGNETNATKISVNKNSIGEGGGVDFVDDSYLTFGDNADLTVFHSATGDKSYIKNSQGIGLGPFEIWSNEFNLFNAAGNKTQITADSRNAVKLYFNNSPKFETTNVGIDVTGITTTDNIVNPGYYNASNGVGTTGQLLSSTVTGTSWIANPNPTPYIWKIEGDSGAITTVANADTIHFKGMNDGGTPLIGITTAFVPSSKELRITANGLADGDGQAGEVAFWSGTGLTSTLAGDTGMTYNAATDNLTVVGIIQGGTLSDGTASINNGVGAAFKSITTTISTTTNNANGFFGPLRTNAASTNYAAGVADQAVQLTGTGTINLNAGGSEVASTTGTYKAGAVIALDVTLNNDAVIGKVLTGLSVPATGNSIEPDDSILIAFGKLQAQHNTSVNGLRYIGTWDARTQAEGGSAGDEGNPALADGGGVITTGTNTSVVADQLVDSGKDFTALGVSIGERVYNQAGTFTTVSAVGTTTLTLNEDIFLTNGQTYSVDNNPALSQGEYYVVNQAGTVDLNGIASWAIGDWVIAGAGNTWEKLDQTGVDGTGSINRIPRWDTVSSLNDSIILQSATGITLDTGKNFATQGAGTITSAAMLTAAVDFTLTGGINLPTGYGGSGQVLTTETAGGGTGTDMVWTTPTTGTLTGVTAGTGITVNPSAAPSPTVNIDYLGTDNAILSATAYSGTEIPGTNQIWFNDENAGANTVSYGLVNQLPFDQYSSWNLSDGTNTAIIASTNTAKILGGAGITSVVSPTDKSATLSIDYVGADNVILSASAGTPDATDELLFNEQDAVGNYNVKRATIASIVGLGDETLAQVLTNGNTTGGTKILVNADDASGGGISLVDDAKIRFSTNGHMQIYGTSTENRIYNSGGPLRISVAGGGYSGSVIMSKGVGAAAETMAEFNTDGSVDLYYDAVKKFETTSVGVTVTGELNVTTRYRKNGYDIISQNSTELRLAADSHWQSFSVYIAGSEELLLSSSGSLKLNSYGSGTNTGTSTYNLEVDSSGNIIETPSTNPGGNGGTFSGSKDIDAGGVIKVFTLTRATTGCLVFDVFFTADFVSGVGGGPPIAEKWTVVHGTSQTPVYNKIISNDGQFGTGGYDVTFADASSGTAVECSVAQRSGSSYPSLSYTIIVGYSENNALTFTPA